MSDVSIYNVIKSSKVNTGNASQFATTRIFYDGVVCPDRANVSDTGVSGVARDTINTYTAGCFSALDRIVVENLQRPRYSIYLNADAIQDASVGDSDLSRADPEYSTSKTYYDTQIGGSTWQRPVLPRNQMQSRYNMSQAMPVNATVANNAQLRESNEVQCIMNTKFNNKTCSTSYQA